MTEAFKLIPEPHVSKARELFVAGNETLRAAQAETTQQQIVMEVGIQNLIVAQNAVEFILKQMPKKRTKKHIFSLKRFDKNCIAPFDARTAIEDLCAPGFRNEIYKKVPNMRSGTIEQSGNNHKVQSSFWFEDEGKRGRTEDEVLVSQVFIDPKTTGVVESLIKWRNDSATITITSHADHSELSLFIDRVSYSPQRNCTITENHRFSHQKKVDFTIDMARGDVIVAPDGEQ